MHWTEPATADDARASEQEIREKIIRQLDRAHRDFTHAQLEFLANVVRFYRGE